MFFAGATIFSGSGAWLQTANFGAQPYTYIEYSVPLLATLTQHRTPRYYYSIWLPPDLLFFVQTRGEAQARAVDNLRGQSHVGNQAPVGVAGEDGAR